MHCRHLALQLGGNLITECEAHHEDMVDGSRDEIRLIFDGDIDTIEEAAVPDIHVVEQPVALQVPHLDELRATFESTATQWQADPVVAEIVIELDSAAWTNAAVTYLAPDADRFLLLRMTPDGMSQERPTLEAFDLLPVTAEGVEQIPSPDALLDPSTLVDSAADVLDNCGVGEPTTVIYATGAPAAWDGERWTETPQWAATVSGEGAAILDPETGVASTSNPCVGH